MRNIAHLTIQFSPAAPSTAGLTPFVTRTANFVCYPCPMSHASRPFAPLQFFSDLPSNNMHYNSLVFGVFILINKNSCFSFLDSFLAFYVARC